MAMHSCGLLISNLGHRPGLFLSVCRYGRDRRVPHDEEVLRELPPAIRSQVGRACSALGSAGASAANIHLWCGQQNGSAAVWSGTVEQMLVLLTSTLKRTASTGGAAVVRPAAVPSAAAAFLQLAPLPLDLLVCRWRCYRAAPCCPKCRCSCGTRCCWRTLHRCCSAPWRSQVGRIHVAKEIGCLACIWLEYFVVAPPLPTNPAAPACCARCRRPGHPAAGPLHAQRHVQILSISAAGQVILQQDHIMHSAVFIVKGLVDLSVQASALASAFRYREPRVLGNVVLWVCSCRPMHFRECWR